MLLNKYLQPYQSHYKPNFRLAMPVILSQGGQMLVNLADTLMVSKVSANALAAASLANAVFFVGFCINIGLSIGITPLVGKAYGLRKYDECSFWLKHGVVAVFISTLLLSALMGSVAFAMPFMGIEAEVTKLAIPYYLILVASTIPVSIFMSIKQFAEGITNTRTAMIITLAANAINILFNYFLIFGNCGFPELGLKGAGYSTLLARILMPIAIIIVFMNLNYFKKYREHLKGIKLQFKYILKVIKMGLPIGGQMSIEAFSFSMGAIMMGWISSNAMAAHQLVMSFISISYMMAGGLGSAATIRVSNYLGAKDFLNLRNSAFSFVHMVILFMSFCAICFLALHKIIPPLTTDNAEVAAIASKLMLIAAAFQIFDGLQVVLLGMLRGLHDVKYPTMVTIVVWILFVLPVSYTIAITLNVGPNGIWIGYLIGLSAACLVLYKRFNKIYKQLIK